MHKRIAKSIFIIFVFLTLGSYETYACVVHGHHCWEGWTKKKPDLKVDFTGYYNKEADGDANAGFWLPKDLRWEKFFDFDDVKPGDFGEGTISLRLKNDNAWGCAILRPRANDDKGSTEPELEVDAMDNMFDKWDGELAQNMEFTLWSDICDKNGASPGDNIFQADCDLPLASGTGPVETLKLALADSENPNVFTGTDEPLKKNGNYFLGVAWNIPSEVENVIQTDAYRADVQFYVQQSKNNPYFRCSDINGNKPWLCESGTTNQCYSGNEDQIGVGICQAGYQVCTKGKWGKCINETLPQKEKCADGLDNDCDGAVDEQDCQPDRCRNDRHCDDGDPSTNDKCKKGKCENKEKLKYMFNKYLKR